MQRAVKLTLEDNVTVKMNAVPLALYANVHHGTFSDTNWLLLHCRPLKNFYVCLKVITFIVLAMVSFGKVFVRLHEH
jgi:hypothetical protein